MNNKKIKITSYILPLIPLFFYVSSDSIAKPDFPEIPKRPSLVELSKSLNNIGSPKVLSESEADKILQNHINKRNNEKKENTNEYLKQ